MYYNKYIKYKIKLQNKSSNVMRGGSDFDNNPKTRLEKLIEFMDGDITSNWFGMDKILERNQLLVFTDTTNQQNFYKYIAYLLLNNRLDLTQSKSLYQYFHTLEEDAIRTSIKVFISKKHGIIRVNKYQKEKRGSYTNLTNDWFLTKLPPYIESFENFEE